MVHSSIVRFSLIASLLSAVGFCAAVGAALAADVQPSGLPPDIPDFSSNNVGWAAASFDFLPPADGGPGPVKNDPKFPFCRNGQGCTVVPRIGDPHSPIL